MKRRAWIAGWLAIAAAVVVLVVYELRVDPHRVVAETTNYGPKEAEVTIEDGDWKTVHLTASKFSWQFRIDKAPEEVWGYNEQLPGPTLRFKPGDKLRVYFRNELDEASSIHWHGLIVPNSMDGVGLVTQPPVMPGETFVYEFEIPNTPGTFMYHAHMNDMEQIGNGLYGAFIVDPRDGGDGQYDQDRVMLLSNWKGNYLINGKEFPNLDDSNGDGQPDEVWLVKKGDLIRVRMINISTVEFHPMHFHGHFTKEIAKDGTDIGNTEDARVENTVLVAPGTTVDVSIKMEAPGKGAWLFHCHVISHVMGPDGLSLNPLLANGGMVAPVIYTDSLNFQQILDSVTAAYGELPDRSGEPVGSTPAVVHDATTAHDGTAAGGAQ